MAFQTTWYFSELPEKVLELIEKDLAEDSSIPDTHWLGGFVWHYIERANRENFLYDLSRLDGSSLKLKTYNEGEGQTWHVDAEPTLGDEDVRKLSFTIQLSDLDDYEGGNVQLLDEVGGKYYMQIGRAHV